VIERRFCLTNGQIIEPTFEKCISLCAPALAHSRHGARIHALFTILHGQTRQAEIATRSSFCADAQSGKAALAEWSENEVTLFARN